MEIRIVLTDTEVSALAHVMDDPQAWTENAIRERARRAIDDIVAEQVKTMLADPSVKTIPANVDKLVAAAPEPAVVESPTLPATEPETPAL